MRLLSRGADAGELLLVDKPAGWTSFDVVNKLRHGHGGLKMGHAGTLDPLATGLLIVCTGRKRKEIDQFMGLDKEYVTALRLGIRTPSYDMATPVAGRAPDVDGITEDTGPRRAGGVRRHAAAAPADVVGGQDRTGRGCTSLRGKGIEVERAPARGPHPVDHGGPDRDTGCGVHRDCSKGTYIRTLVNDIGETAGMRCDDDGAAADADRPLSASKMHCSVEQLVERARELRRGMNVVRSFDTLHREKNSVVTVGTFDGIHLAHREIIREVVHRARMREGRSVVVTFDPHPKEVVASTRGAGPAPVDAG